MLSTYNYKNIKWIDLESPTKEEVRSVMEEYHIHPLVADELLSPTLRPKVESHSNCVYLILHFPVIYNMHGKSESQEIDFIIGKDFLITTHYEVIDPLHEFSKVFETNSLLDKSDIEIHAGYLFFYIAKELYRSLALELDSINRELEDVEEKIFAGGEDKMVKVLSRVTRDLLNVRQAIYPHKDILNSFEVTGTTFFGNDFKYHLRSIVGEYYKISNILEGHKETVQELRITNDSLLTTKTNNIMKILTIMAFITFPLSLIASIFSMNTQHMPIIGEQNDFWIIIIFMLGATAMMFIYFKYKKWI